MRLQLEDRAVRRDLLIDGRETLQRRAAILCRQQNAIRCGLLGGEPVLCGDLFLDLGVTRPQSSGEGAAAPLRVEAAAREVREVRGDRRPQAL